MNLAVEKDCSYNVKFTIDNSTPAEANFLRIQFVLEPAGNEAMVGD